MDDQEHLPAMILTGLLEPSVAAFTLSMLRNLPPALNNEQYAQVKALAKASPPSLPGIGEKAFVEAMTMLRSSLPSRKAGDETGEVHMRVYRRCLSHLSAPEMWWTVEQAVKRLKFYPSVKELLDIAEGWVRRDDATEAQRLAKLLVNREVNRRLREQSRKAPAPPLTQQVVDAMAPELRSMGLKLGYLIEQDGKVIPAPEQEDAA